MASKVDVGRGKMGTGQTSKKARQTRDSYIKSTER